MSNTTAHANAFILTCQERHSHTRQTPHLFKEGLSQVSRTEFGLLINAGCSPCMA